MHENNNSKKKFSCLIPGKSFNCNDQNLRVPTLLKNVFFSESDFKKIINRKSVFYKQNTLDMSYIPDELYCRDKELEKIITDFKNILQGDVASKNYLILGNGGTGKSVLIKFIAENFKNVAVEYGMDLFIEYYNCNNFNSKDKIIREIFSRYYPGSGGRGFAFEETLKKILTNLIHSKQKYMFLIIDDVHRLSYDDIYSFLNISSTFGHHNSKFSIFLVSRIRDWKIIENEAIKSKISERVILDPYSEEEVFKILKNRSNLAFMPNVISIEALKILSRLIVKKYNLRIGIIALNRCGLYCDIKGLNKITPQIVKEALKNIPPYIELDLDCLRNHTILSLYGIVRSLIKESSKNRTINGKITDNYLKSNVNKKSNLFKKRSFTSIDNAYKEYQDLCFKYNIASYSKTAFRGKVRELDKLNIIKSQYFGKKENKGIKLKIELIDISIRKLKSYLDYRCQNKFDSV